MEYLLTTDPDILDNGYLLERDKGRGVKHHQLLASPGVKDKRMRGINPARLSDHNEGLCIEEEIKALSLQHQECGLRGGNLTEIAGIIKCEKKMKYLPDC